MRVLLTGADGFLGWHTRIRLTLEGHTVVPVTRHEWHSLPDLITDVEAIVHVAGINRGPDLQVEWGNVDLAKGLVDALRFAQRLPSIIFANSVQAWNDTPYGRGKGKASDLLAAAATVGGLRYIDVVLPNLFGEHGRPHYNSVVQTFVDAVITGERPRVDDRPINLLHAQAAAQAFADSLQNGGSGSLRLAGTPTSVAAILATLESFRALYVTGDLPRLNDKLDVDLFNTLRAALFPSHYPIWIRPRRDLRGSLAEVVRSHGGEGQTFVSTTQPGKTRGEHFHLRKVERFVVLSGHARIDLRRLFDDKVIHFEVSGDQLGIVDMPTMWAHNITNVGDSELTTLFWVNQLFDPNNPDTYPEPVSQLPSADFKS